MIIKKAVKGIIFANVLDFDNRALGYIFGKEIIFELDIAD